MTNTPGIDYNAALSALATRLDPHATGVSNVQRGSGGATQDIWRFDLEGPRPCRLILRRAPRGRAVPPAIGLDNEAALMAAAAAAGVPVPCVRLVLDPDHGLGDGFIMDFIDGETLGGRIVRAEAANPSGLAYECGATLAAIHRIELAAVPRLDRLTPAGLVAQCGTAYEATEWPRPVFAAALRWLGSNAPLPRSPCVVHGDFRNGNLMIGPEGLRAVLDWELAHVGDACEDLGWLCVNSWRFGRIDRPVGGFGDYDELLDGYAAAGGEPIERAALHWWEVLGTLRWGVMCAGMATAFRVVDPTIERAMIAKRASETEIDLLRLLEIG